MRSVSLAFALLATAMPAVAQTSPAAQAPAAQAPAAPVAGQAALDKRIDEVAAVLLGKARADDVFAPAFLAQVPATQLATLKAQLTAGYGALTPDAAVTATGAWQGNFVLRFARAEARGQLVLESAAPHRVTGLQIAEVKPVGDDATALTKDLASLPGAVNAWFGPLEGGTPRLSVNADRPLALGSTFKLFVLSALQRQVAAGTRSWNEVAPLTTKSFPSGVMQDWPAGTPVTIQTLATLMLQISDNTATDQLIQLVGRDAVEAELRRSVKSPAPSLPFLATREMFEIKADPAFRTRYATASENERRTMLRNLPTPGPTLAQITTVFAGPPIAIDRIEWFATPAELAAVLRPFTASDAATARGTLSAGKGMSPDIAAKWNYVGFKGGSEPGVLNLTWLLQDKAGAWHVATLGWNNPAAPVDQARLVALANRMLALAD